MLRRWALRASVGVVPLLSCRSLLPPLDANARAMAVYPAPVVCAGTRAPTQARVPRTLHQIDLPSAPGASVRHAAARARWAQYAEQFGYGHRVWSSDDVRCGRIGLAGRAGALLRQAVRDGHTAYVGELLRLAVLDAHGGIYVADTLSPPQQAGAWVDFAQLVPLSGLMVSTAWIGRNLGTSAIAAATDLLAAPPHHPVVRHLIDSVPANHDALAGRRLAFDPNYAVGPHALTRALAGAVAVVPASTLTALGMLRDD